MVAYKLYYFNFRGRAEIIRYLFALSGEKYEDIRFEREKWPEYKPKSPLGQCPFLEVQDGSHTLVLSQSIAITRYLAKKFGLAGKDENEQVIIDMYADQLGDLTNEIVIAFKETDEARKKAQEEKLMKEIIPNNFKLFEEKIAKSGTGFISTSGLTWVDLYLFVLLDWLAEKRDKVLEHFAHIKALDEKIKANPKIAEWLAKRPVTPM